MSIYKIIGQLLNTNQQPLQGLKISAWDKDKRVSDYLGSAYSDAKGQFTINFTKEKFFDGKEDILPDVFFLVYQGNRVIHSTEDEPIKNAKDFKNITLVIDRGEESSTAPNSEVYSLQGSVLQKQTKTPLPDLKVEAWDKDKKVCDQLGLTITDDKGAFFIQYDASRFRDAPTDYLPDVFFRIYEGEKMIHSTEGKPLKNVSQLKDFELTITYEEITEAERFPNLPKASVLDLARHAALSPNELKKKKPKIYSQLVRRAQQEVSKTASTFFEKASFDLKHYVKKMDFSKLKEEDISVTSFIADETKNSHLTANAKNEARALLLKWNGPKDINELLQPEIPLNENPLFEREKQQAHVFRIAEITSLNDTIAEQLVAKTLSLHGLGTETINNLVKEKVVTKKQGETLQLNAQVYTLSEGNLELTNALKKYSPNRNLKSVAELVVLEIADWKALLTKAKVSTDKKTIAQLAKVKQKQVELLYTNQTFIAQSKKKELPKLKSLMNKFYSANTSLDFLGLDYRIDSEDLNKLQLGSFSYSEQQTIIENLKTNQRLFNLTQDVADTLQLKKDYQSSRDIVLDGYHAFQEKTQFEETKANQVFQNAEQISVQNNIGTIDVLGEVVNPWYGGMIGGTTQEVQQYLRQLKGYEEFFGVTDFCKCKHCNSILSPAAYYVDLMDFLKEHILSTKLNPEGHTFVGDAKDSILNPKVRRPDLWESLVLNCDNTHDMVPYLTIINEVLENFVYTKHDDSNIRELLSDRTTIENFTYGLLGYRDIEDDEVPMVHSIHQPFYLPLTQLEVYLQHFPITRASIAEILLADVVDEKNILVHSTLGLSLQSYNLLVNQQSGNTGNAFLRNLFGLEIPRRGAITNLEVQELLPVLDIDRKEFTALLQTQFVNPNPILNPSEIRIRGGRKDGALQTNVEYVDGVKQGDLDRMHRFIRLYKKVDWSIIDLDRIITSLGLAVNHSGLGHLYLKSITQALKLQKKIKLTVDELLTFIYALPNSLLDARFNLPVFTKTHGEWTIANLKDLEFRHPGYVDDPSDDKTIQILHRLLAGLGVNDEELFGLIKNLETTLGASASGANIGEIVLNIDKLTILYRHAWLLKKFKLSADELFFLIRSESKLEPNFISSLSDLEVFVESYEWYKASNYTLKELSEILEPSRDADASFEMVNNIINEIHTFERLIFADTLFAYEAEVTEQQSKKIIKDNPTVFEATNRDGFYRLTPDFDINSALDIPTGVLPQEKAKSLVLARHVIEVIPSILAQRLNLNTEKVKALGLLAGFDFTNADFGKQLSRIIQGIVTPEVLEELIVIIQKLAVWFKDKIFDIDTLAFIHKSSGGANAIFQISKAQFKTPILKKLKQTDLYRQLLKGTEEELVTELHIILDDYNFSVAKPNFNESSYETLAKLLDTEMHVAQKLNDTTLFPNTNETGDTSNESLRALLKFRKVYALVQFLGIGAETISNFISYKFGELLTAVTAVVTAIRTKYDTEEEWKERIGPFEDKILTYKRDALTDYLMHSWRSNQTTDGNWFETSQDLYNHFLIDTELEGCARTSRLVAGISSLQTYIQRCLLNLEQNSDGSIHVLPTYIPKGEWEWRKNYRVWEANRKVFLYPENYIEPDLRDNKTELFNELESTLLQQEINTQNAEQAYKKYLQGFDEVSSLKIAGSYHDLGNMDGTNWPNEPDTLHLFGVTASEPPVYYYRTIENIYKKEKNGNLFSVKYNSWEKINLQVPAKKVSPIVFQNKLYVFWVEIVTRPKNQMVNGSSQFSGYEHKMTVKFSSLQLNGTWQVPQAIKLEDPIFERGEGVIWDPLVESEELNRWLNPIGSAFPDNRIKREILKAIKSGILEEEISLSNRRYFLNMSPYGFPVIGSINLENPVFRNLLKPKYELDGTNSTRLHLEPKDAYTLYEEKWTRIYPAVDLNQNIILEGFNYEFENRLIDLFNLEILDTASRSGLRPGLYSGNKRLSVALDGAFVFTGFPQRRHMKNYMQASRLASNWNLSEWRKTDGNPGYNVLLNSGSRFKLDIVNGTLTDGIIEKDGDLVYLHSTGGRLSGYAIERLNTTLYQKINRTLFEYGIDGLLDIQVQFNSLREKVLPFEINLDEVWDDSTHHISKMDTNGSLGTYFRELFFHIPFLIANHLNSQKKFEEAQRWYHYIFNPTGQLLNDEKEELKNATDAKKRREIMANRVWQFIEFRKHTLATWKQNLDDKKAISAYENDPFNPHAIARLRLGAYMKSITMKYIDNLLDWGDHLFAQDTMESINEATLLYSMASEILGQRPIELGDCEQGDINMTYNSLKSEMNSRSCYNFLNEVESEVTKPKRPWWQIDRNRLRITNTSILEAGQAARFSIPEVAASVIQPISNNTFDFGLNIDFGLNPTQPSNTQNPLQFNLGLLGGIIYIPSFHTSFLKQVCHFCIPPNPDLIAYWDRVEDRLFKIRNCMNISGVRRQLSLFAPEIDPRLLVRAKAAGLSLDEVLNSIQGDLPPYRFAFLLAKAKEYAGALQGFGGALLGSLEKKSAEELTMLRLAQQDEVLKMTMRLRDMEIQAAEASLEGLRKRKESVEFRNEYYENLIDQGLSEWENIQQVTKHLSNGLIPGAIALLHISGGLSLIPRILGMANTTGGEEATDSVKIFGEALRMLSGHLGQIADSMGLEANFHRREQGWEFSLNQTENELKELEKQLVAAEIRRDISIKSKELHEKSIEQHQETYEFYRDRFTNLGLYTWLSSELQKMFRESYQNAMTLARMAERAYRFERNDDTAVLLDGNYWEASKAGLLAGEKLMNALRKMELRYMETNTRSMEVDQAFSLTQIDPKALLDLKTTGECTFTVPELYFDLFYPGQYRRRVKSARLTIPCITGPYSNVSAVLTLKESHIRKEAKLPTDSDNGLTMVPPSRSTTIATSTAQSDSGVFRLDFRDERYMPFEGAGAVKSTWQIKLPKTFRPFDYSSINDCILHISYTAEYDISFRELVESESGHLNTLLSSNNFVLPRIFSLRQEFSQTFHQLMHSTADTEVPLELSEKHFPLFLQGKTLEITEAKLLIEIDENGFRGDGGGIIPPDLTSFDISISGNSGAVEPSPDWSINTDSGQLIESTSVKDAFTIFTPVTSPLQMRLKVRNGGDFSMESPVASDPSALDDHKIKDIYLYIAYKVIGS